MSPAEAPADAEVHASSRRWDSRRLLEGARQVEILHQGEVYRLQVTRKGGLILTK